MATIAEAKALHESAWQIFLRGVGCNWLVCLGVWLLLASDAVSGKILGIFFPVMAFVAMGFDHVVANMFFLPAAIFAGVPDLGWDDTLRNWALAFLGNLVCGNSSIARSVPAAIASGSPVPRSLATGRGRAGCHGSAPARRRRRAP